MAKFWLTFSGVLAASLAALLRFITFHPKAVENAELKCSNRAPTLMPGQKIKIMTWNVQYMASKDYVFYYDLPEGNGPDIMPSRESVVKTINEVARVVKDEDPDIVLFQELDVGAKKTHYIDELSELLGKMKNKYPCYTAAWYWKAAFVPHPKIMGKVGMKMAIFSKYKIKSSLRYSLPMISKDPVTKLFYLKRALIEARIPIKGRCDFIVMDTHLDAFAQGTNTMKRQISKIKSILDGHTKEDSNWILTGDFNLIAPGKSHGRLPEIRKKYYRKISEIKPLTDTYKTVPTLDEINGPEYKKWLTHFPNDPRVKKPSETIDYIFHSDSIKIGRHYVRQKDTLHISDHLPVIAEITIPK